MYFIYLSYTDQRFNASSPRKIKKENCSSSIHEDNTDHIKSPRTSPRKVRKDVKEDTEDLDVASSVRSSPRKAKKERFTSLNNETDQTDSVRSSPRKMKKENCPNTAGAIDSKPSSSRRKSVALGLQRQQSKCFTKGLFHKFHSIMNSHWQDGHDCADMYMRCCVITYHRSKNIIPKNISYKAFFFNISCHCNLFTIFYHYHISTKYALPKNSVDSPHPQSTHISKCPFKGRCSDFS